MNLRLVRRLIFLLSVVCSLTSVLADTEIRNFRLPLPHSPLPTIFSANPIYALNHHIHQLNLTVSQDDPEKYVALHVDSTQFWTIRLSWPASSPTKWIINLHPSDKDDQIVAHLSASLLSPRMPHPFLSSLPQPFANTQTSSLSTSEEWSTTFHLVVEPVLYGFIPQSSLPNVYAILMIGLIGLGISPLVIRFMEEWVSAETMDLAPGPESLREKSE